MGAHLPTSNPCVVATGLADTSSLPMYVHTYFYKDKPSAHTYIHTIIVSTTISLEPHLEHQDRPITTTTTMSTEQTESPAPDPPIVFRPKKKPRLRQRAAETTLEKETAREERKPGRGANDDRVDNEEDVTAAAAADEEVSFSVAEALKRRRKNRPKGVEFKPERPSASTQQQEGHDREGQGPAAGRGDDGAAPQQEPSNVVVGGIRGRFAPQTGLIGELVNKHM